jgi:hypothetical protein
VSLSASDSSVLFSVRQLSWCPSSLSSICCFRCNCDASGGEYCGIFVVPKVHRWVTRRTSEPLGFADSNVLILYVPANIPTKCFKYQGIFIVLDADKIHTVSVKVQWRRKLSNPTIVIVDSDIRRILEEINNISVMDQGQLSSGILWNTGHQEVKLFCY